MPAIGAWSSGLQDVDVEETSERVWTLIAATRGLFFGARMYEEQYIYTVSYTHLTLPTKDCV